MKYITRTTEGIRVVDQTETYKEKGLIQYLNELCIQELTTFTGRIQATKQLCNIQSNIPLFINESLLFFPTKSNRNPDVYYINYHRIIGVQKVQNHCKICFDDFTELAVNCTYQKIQNQIRKVQKVLTILER